MRENILIVLNAKTKKEAMKELLEVVDYIDEDKNKNWIAKGMSHLNKEYYIDEYNEIREEYRQHIIEHDLMSKGLFESTDIEGCIQECLEYSIYETFEAFLEHNNIVGFNEDEVALFKYNKHGWIDRFEKIKLLKKYKNVKHRSKLNSNYEISTIIDKNKSIYHEEVLWDYPKVELKTRAKNKIRKRKELLKRIINNDDYVAVIRVHF